MTGLLRVGIPSKLDPYRLNELPLITDGGQIDCDERDGRTQVVPGLVGGENTAVIICVGQSNTCNFSNTEYTPTNSKVHNLSIVTGGVYQAKDPLLGAAWEPGNTSGGWPGRLGDKLIAASKYARVILVPISVGSTDITQWAAGGNLNHRIGVVAARLAAVSLSATHVLITHGERDSSLGTSQSAYTTGLQSLIDSFSNAGVSAPVYVAKESWISGSTSSAIRAAQASVVDNVSVFQGPDMDALGSSYRYDNTHLNATGCDSFATSMAALF